MTLMAQKVRLDPTWWKKNGPDSTSRSAVENALKDFSKCRDAIVKSGDARSYFKSVGRLKSAIAKVQQEVKKGKDKNVQELLAEMETLADEQTKGTEGHLTIKSDSVKGLSGVSGVKAPSADPQDPITLVNGLDRAWSIVKDGKPDGAAKRRSCQAIPKGMSAKNLSGWKAETTSWSYVVKNRLNENAVELRFQLRYRWNGQSDTTKGLFLTDCGVWADANTMWGYTVSVEASVKGQPFNSGSRKAVVGAIPLLISINVSTPMKSFTKEWLITCHGNRQRDLK